MNTSKTKPKVKTATVVYAGASATNIQLHLRMSDCSSRLVRVSDRPSNKFLNGLVGLQDEALGKKFGASFKGWRKPQ